MPRLRVGPNPLTLGLAAGIPSATSGIVDVLKLRESQRHREAIEAVYARQLAIQEASAQRAAQEFQRLQGLRAEYPSALATTRAAVGGLRPAMIPEMVTPAFAEPFVSEAEAGGMLPPAGGAVGPVRPELVTPATFTRPSVSSAFQTPEQERALGVVEELRPHRARQLEEETRTRLHTEEQRLRVTESNRLLQEAGRLAARNPLTAMDLTFRALEARGVPVPPQLVWEAVKYDKEAAQQTADILAPAWEQALTKRDPTAMWRLAALAATTPGPLGPVAVTAAFKLLGEMGDFQWIGRVSTAWQAARAKQPADQPLSDQQMVDIMTGLVQTPGDQQAMKYAMTNSPEIKAVWDRVQGKKQKTAEKEGEREAIPPEERERKGRLEESQIRRNLTLAEKEPPSERKERTQAEARAQLDAYTRGEGADLSFPQVNALHKDAGLKLFKSPLDAGWIMLEQQRKNAQRGGVPPSKPAPSAPDPAQYRGRGITDKTTGKHYRSNGTQWIEGQ